MKPFVLQQHDSDRAALRDLIPSELSQVGGGQPVCDSEPGIGNASTWTVTKDGGQDDGCDN